MSTMRRVAVELVAYQTVYLDVETEGRARELFDLSADEIEAALESADRFLWSEDCRVADAFEVAP